MISMIGTDPQKSIGGRPIAQPPIRRQSRITSRVPALALPGDLLFRREPPQLPVEIISSGFTLHRLYVFGVGRFCVALRTPHTLRQAQPNAPAQTRFQTCLEFPRPSFIFDPKATSILHRILGLAEIPSFTSSFSVAIAPHFYLVIASLLYFHLHLLPAVPAYIFRNSSPTSSRLSSSQSTMATKFAELKCCRCRLRLPIERFYKAARKRDEPVRPQNNPPNKRP